MRFLSNFGCKKIFMCSVTFWHQQEYNSFFKGKIGALSPQGSLNCVTYLFTYLLYSVVFFWLFGILLTVYFTFWFTLRNLALGKVLFCGRNRTFLLTSKA